MKFFLHTLLGLFALIYESCGYEFVKEYVAVQEEPKSDYSCKGYVLINDLKVLLCENIKYNFSADSLDVSVVLEAESLSVPLLSNSRCRSNLYGSGACLESSPWILDHFRRFIQRVLKKEFPRNLCFNRFQSFRLNMLWRCVVLLMNEYRTNDESEGFDGVADFVMKTLFRNAHLKKTTMHLDSDGYSIGSDSSSLNFHQNKISREDKLSRFVQQMINMKFDPHFVNPSMKKDEKSEGSLMMPSALEQILYNKYAEAFSGRHMTKNRVKTVHGKGLFLQEAIKFYQRHYSSDKMTIVLSQKNIVQFQAKYLQLLSMIPKRRSKERKPYRINYEIRIPNAKVLQLYFPMPTVRQANEVSYEYLRRHFFNANIRNGFEWMLKESGLVDSVSTSFRATDWSNNDVVFEVSVKLTENGLKNTRKVLELIFSYLNRIRSNKIEKWIHDELVETIDPHANKIEYDLMEFPRDVALRAFKYGLRNSLVGVEKNFDKQMIRNIMNKLNAYNFNCLHGVPERGSSNATRLIKISPIVLDKLQTIRLKEADAIELPVKDTIVTG